MKYIDRFFDLIKVYEAPFTKIRVGRENDGGYIVPEELLRSLSGMYSVGIGGDDVFEKHMEQIGVKVIAVDMTQKYNEDSFVGLLGRDITIQQLRRQSPIAGNKALKFDIEGDEFDAIGYHKDYEFIVCELHLFTVEDAEYRSPYFSGVYKKFYDDVNENLFKKYFFFLDSLMHNYFIWHIHGNNSVRKQEVCGYMFPPLLELTLINRKHLPALPVLCSSKYPVDGLDAPNKTDRPDFDYIFPFKL